MTLAFGGVLKDDFKKGNRKMPPTSRYDDREIMALVKGLGQGNPGRDQEVLLLLRKILVDPVNSGLSNDTLEQIRIAVG